MLTFLIAQAGILLGDLNVLAPVITMFFMVTYGMLNFSTRYEKLADNPSYRPRFKYFSSVTSFLGTLGCLAIMLLINTLAAVLSLVFLLVIVKYVEGRAVKTAWGDATAGFLFSRTRQNLLKLERLAQHSKNWKPSILVMSGNPRQRLQLVRLAGWLEAGKGLIVLGNVIPGRLEDVLEKKQAQEALVRDFLEQNRLEAFYEVIAADDFASGAEALIQAAGVGRLKPNTVMFGFSGHRERFEVFGRLLRETSALGKNIVIVKPEGEPIHRNGVIDVWRRGVENGGLMALFAHLLRVNPEWHGRRMRILRLVSREEEKAETLENLRALIYRARIEAEPVVIVSGDPFWSVLRRMSPSSSAVFLGLNIPEEGRDTAFFDELTQNLSGMPTVILVKSCLSESLLFS